MVKKTFNFKPEGVCSKCMEVTVEDDILVDLKSMGGCNGNLQGIKALAMGRPLSEVIEKLSGIRCGAKNTSCPDQVARALSNYLKDKEV